MNRKKELIEYLIDMICKDNNIFIEFMGYTDIMNDLVELTINDMTDDELNDVIMWYSEEYDDINDFEKNG